jgi:NADPH2:quinone reductase
MVTMKAVAFNRFGGSEALEVVRWTKPQASGNRVLVRVVCASINPVDQKVRAGEAFPFSPATVFPKVRSGGR